MMYCVRASSMQKSSSSISLSNVMVQPGRKTEITGECTVAQRRESEWQLIQSQYSLSPSVTAVGHKSDSQGLT